MRGKQWKTPGKRLHLHERDSSKGKIDSFND